MKIKQMLAYLGVLILLPLLWLIAITVAMVTATYVVFTEGSSKLYNNLMSINTDI